MNKQCIMEAPISTYLLSRFLEKAVLQQIKLKKGKNKIYNPVYNGDIYYNRKIWFHFFV